MSVHCLPGVTSHPLIPRPRISRWSSSRRRWTWYVTTKIRALIHTVKLIQRQSGEREVSAETIKDLAVRWGIPIYETSAKNGWHVKEVFNHLLSEMRKRYPEGGPKERLRTRDACILM